MSVHDKHDHGAPRDEPSSRQFSTFSIAGRLYGIDVTRVQEVVRPMGMTRIPLAPPFIVGLINLRGQVATAVGLRELFDLSVADPAVLMNVVCKTESMLLSFLVDDIGDVVEVRREDFEGVPSTVNDEIRRFLAGIYKVNGGLLSIIDIDPITKFLSLAVKSKAA